MIKELLMTWLWTMLYSISLWIWEVRFPRKQLNYAAELYRELLTPVVRFLFSLIVVYVSTYFLQLLISPSLKDVLTTIRVSSLPFWLRVIICYVLADFTFYISHWAMHNHKILWQTHKYHHSPDKLWVLSGYRVSILSMFIIQLGYTWFILLEVPSQAAVFLLFHSVWVHINITNYSWMRVVEWIFVTPRFHSVHHFSRPELQGKNLGGMFTFFDRIFGTYVNPETFDFEMEEIGLGTDEPTTVRMMLGF
jgi:sterol desaturase/sphingolipid hydroxylase (fatty acid hydroxylase superfamily)